MSEGSLVGWGCLVVERFRRVLYGKAFYFLEKYALYFINRWFEKKQTNRAKERLPPDQKDTACYLSSQVSELFIFVCVGSRFRVEFDSRIGWPDLSPFDTHRSLQLLI